ncbi:MAG: class I SAM-dependent methyltransferase [Planctomycetia bacterium]|nr:class I SAM-dependent methyltransferase [Planctomycetia bacterium]
MPKTAADAYRDDLAYIHDAGFGHLAVAAAGELIGQLRQQGTRDGLVVELGCGSGNLSERVAAAGFQVCGFDISPAMVALAQNRVPRGEFHCESFLTARLPRCVAVAAIGEVLNYLFDARRAATRLPRVFRRAYKALLPGGLLLFDVATPGRRASSAGTPKRPIGRASSRHARIDSKSCWCARSPRFAALASCTAATMKRTACGCTLVRKWPGTCARPVFAPGRSPATATWPCRAAGWRLPPANRRTLETPSPPAGEGRGEGE